jgi:hypothetical protein
MLPNVSLSLSTPEVSSTAVLTPDVEVEKIRVIVFRIDRYLYIMPFQCLIRVINTPTDLQSRLDQMGLLYIGQSAIKLVSIDRSQLTPTTLSNPSPFIVVFQLQAGALYGLLVDTPPDLLDLPVSTFLPLPEAHQQTAPLQLVSYVAIPEGATEAAHLYFLNLQKMTAVA